jgi:hypothetical protein
MPPKPRKYCEIPRKMVHEVCVKDGHETAVACEMWLRVYEQCLRRKKGVRHGGP